MAKTFPYKQGGSNLYKVSTDSVNISCVHRCRSGLNSGEDARGRTARGGHSATTYPSPLPTITYSLTRAGTNTPSDEYDSYREYMVANTNMYSRIQ